MITLETWYKIYELSINPADLRLITFKRLIFVFSSIMNFWMNEWLVLILKICIYHNPEKC